MTRPASVSSGLVDPGAINALAEAFGFVCWTSDPGLPMAAATQTNIHAGGVYIAKGKTITGLGIGVTVAGVGMISAQLGVYDAGMVLVAQSADSPTVVQSTGWVFMNLTAPWTAPYSGLYYLAFSNSTATSNPTFLNSASNNLVNGLPMPGPGLLRAIHGQIQGTLPNILTPLGGFTNIPVIVAY